MSRLIVKNLPNKITVDSLKELFGQKGEVTDVQLKYTKDGKFRNFGFVGFRSEEQASAAREHFNGTCVRSMKIQVEVCANLGDEKKPRAWSKYAPDSTAYKKLHKSEVVDDKAEMKKLSKKEKNKTKLLELLKKHKDDPLFAEFMEAHITDKNTWINEALEAAKSDDHDSGLEDEHAPSTTAEQTPEPPIDKSEQTNQEKVANKQISDLEYMKLLMKKVDGYNEKVPEKVEDDKPKKVRNRPLFHIKITGLPFKCKKKDIKEFFRPLVPYSIRLPGGKKKNLSGFCFVGFRTEKELKKALAKDKLFLGNHRVHVSKYEDKAKKAAEEEEQDVKRKRQENQGNEESIGESGSIFVRNLPYIVSEEEITSLFEKFVSKESGLPHLNLNTQGVVSKRGPLAETNLPIDSVTRQSKGFAMVTFVMPEHAVQAYSALDGTSFCGRMLHLLPARAEKAEDSDDEGLSFKEKKAKKLRKEAKSSHNWNSLFLGANAVADVVATNYSTTKEQLLSDENKKNTVTERSFPAETALKFTALSWCFVKNHLGTFIFTNRGSNKYLVLISGFPENTVTERSFPAETALKFTALSRCFVKNNLDTSAAVRLALGETQLVSETRHFLENNGVYLEAFNTAAKKRSKTCILVKNLPANTDNEELKALFAKHGHIARFLMPKHGISALVDFVEPFEAKKAFTKLAYSQFKTAPLYLEWAPENVFVKTAEKTDSEPKQSTIDNKEDELRAKTDENKKIKKTKTQDEIETRNTEKLEAKAENVEEEVGEPENDSVLFVKNLNFKTTENSLKEHFQCCGKLHSVTIAKKKDPKNPGQFLSMGYGFVQFYKKAHANNALKELQSSTLDGKTLELKRSERGNTNEVKTNKKDTKHTAQNGTKILVRNVPFQANRNELHEIFRAFGEIKTLRLPKKLTPGSDQHRGFAFVDYHSKADAKAAFEALCHSTHLYGRRLVLEWADQTDENEDVDALRKRTAQAFNAKSLGGKKSRKGAVDVETFVDGE